MPEAARVLIGPAEMPLTRMPLAPSALGQEAHAGLQRGLGQAHGVVVGHVAHGAQVAQRQQRGAWAQAGQGGLGQRREAVGRDVVRDAEVLARHAVEKIAGDGLARRKGDGMHKAVELVPVRAQVGEQALDLGVVRRHRSRRPAPEPNSAANSVMRCLKRSPW